MATKNTKVQTVNAVGRRKSAIANVVISAGKGDVKTNWEWPKGDNTIIVEPLELTGAKGKYDLKFNFTGGGIKSRIIAARLAVSRALLKLDEENKATLRQAGFLTRDPREKERKKPGLRRARRAPQWAKR